MLDRGQRRLLIDMCFMAVMIELHLRILGYPRTVNWLDRSNGGRLDLAQTTIMQICSLVTDKVLGREGKCLRRALLATHYLRRSGYPAEVQIGYRQMNGRTEGHAWVEVAGRVLCEDPNIRKNYPAQFHSMSRAFFGREI